VLIHAAGITPGSPAAEMSLDHWRSAMDINANGTFLTNQAVFPHLKVDGGATSTSLPRPAWGLSRQGGIHREQPAAHDQSMAKSIPLGGKLGDVERYIVPVMAFLTSGGARCMTGQIFAIDGGNAGPLRGGFPRSRPGPATPLSTGPGSGGVSGRNDGLPPILLVHGSGANHLWWHVMLTDLRVGHRVIEIDLSGHGESEHRPA